VLRSIRLIGANLLTKRAAVRLPDRVPPPANFRGEVLLDPENCLACGMCAYVCVSEAIKVVEYQDSFAWSYQPGQCTFCARCVERCSGQALCMKPDPMRAYTHAGELNVQHVVTFPKCRECGQTVRPAGVRIASLAFESATEDTRELLTLCERCKRKHLQRHIFTSEPELVEANR
jgi:formate hydrogenlyase subunit 6/NADH:ubiquinone oxidoreductase subunit I